MGLGQANVCWRGQEITLNDTHGTPVATGIKIHNNLYKMNVKSCNGTRTDAPSKEDMQITFVATSQNMSWEMWHCHFSHLSYDSLQKLLQKNMVNEFEVSKGSTLSNCVTCVEVKMTVDSYKTVLKHYQKPGELTHIDMWGKYEVASINSHQYYIVFVDDTTRYTTINFLKRKDEASI